MEIRSQISSPGSYVGLGDLTSEDYRVLYIWYHANDWDPSPSDCDWFIPGTLEQEEEFIVPPPAFDRISAKAWYASNFLSSAPDK